MNEIRTMHAAPGLSRRTLFGGALAVAGAAAAVSAVSPRTAAAAGAVRPAGTAPEPPAQLYFHLLPAPVRAYDSRPGYAPDGTDPNTGAGDTQLTSGSRRTVDLAYVLGDPTDPTGVPEDAVGVLLNLTVTGGTGGGYLRVWSHGVTEPSSSSINWERSGITIANMVTTASASGYVDVRCGGGSSTSTHFLMDVVGYYTAVYTGP